MSPAFTNEPDPFSTALATRASPAPGAGFPERDVRAATASQLIAEVTLLQDTIASTSVLDTRIPGLLLREQVIRGEIGRRDVLLMQGILWSTPDQNRVQRTTEYPSFSDVPSRNGRGGPGGPGGWDD